MAYGIGLTRERHLYEILSGHHGGTTIHALRYVLFGPLLTPDLHGTGHSNLRIPTICRVLVHSRAIQIWQSAMNDIALAKPV